MDSGRRAFFGRLFGGAAVAVPAVVASTGTPAALKLANPLCPKCCYTQRIPAPHDFASMAAWETAMRTPTRIVCGNERCKTEMTITFAS